MKRILATALAAVFLAAVGCATVTHELDSLSDDQLASYLETGAHKATALGVKYAIRKNPEKVNQIRKDGALAEQAIRQVVVPDFSGASLGTVSKGAVDVAIGRLSDKLNGSPLEAIVLVADTVAAQVPLPTNPTGKLSPRLQKAVAAFFLGMAEGLDDALGIAPPAASAPGTPAPPAPPPTPAPPK